MITDGTMVACPPAICERVDQGGAGGDGAREVAPSQRTSDSGDPWEGFNRGLYGANEVLDRFAVRPAAMTYKRVLPRPVRTGVRHVLSNLDEPRLAIDHLLQGKPKRAGGAAVRFAANSTLGVFGLFDVADRAGLKRVDTDFGITLGRAHFGPGPYLYVPLLGPSSVRDVVGTGVDFALDPLNWIQYRGSGTTTTATTILQGLDARAGIERDMADMKRSSVDPYATIRSIYLQLRASEVRGGAVDVKDLPDFPDEEAAPEPTPEAGSSTPPMPQ